MITGGDLIEVESVSVEKDFVLSIQFSNGQQKKIDLTSLLKNPPPVFTGLRDMSEFKKVDGLMVAMKTTSYVDGKKFMTITSTEHKNLEKVDAKEFNLND